MVNLKINNVPITVPEGTTILEACKQAHYPVPSLCYLKGINDIGACRVCCVEIVGVERLVTSCNNVAKSNSEYTQRQRQPLRLQPTQREATLSPG